MRMKSVYLSSYFSDSAKFWLGLQNDFDIEAERDKKKEILRKIKRVKLT